MSPRRGHGTIGVDRVAARELLLFMENDSRLYRDKKDYQVNLDRKRKRGIYDHEKAVRLWLYYVDRGARLYNREFSTGGGDSGGWTGTLKGFDRPTRLAVAQEFAVRDEQRAANPLVE